MIGLGELNRTAEFRVRRETGRNALNEPVFADAAPVRVRVRRRDVSDQERVSAGREDSAIMARFVMQSRPVTRALTPNQTFQCDGRAWSIEGIKQVAHGLNRFLEVTAVSLDENKV